MRALIAAPAAVAIALLGAGPADADVASAAPPYVDHTEWVHWGDMSSLRVYPTSAGRVEAGQVGTTAQGDEAWGEVLTLSPDADIPGMREQFLCHWQFAEFAQPGKTSWNVEPWRPVVDAQTMVDAGCNPGGSAEPF